MAKNCVIENLVARNLAQIECFAEHHFRWVEVTGSTNDDLKALAEHDSAFYVLLSDFQTSGRGRLARSWQARPRHALLFSFSLPGSAREFPLSLLTGIAVIRALASLRLSAWLKWPNDIYVGSQKLAGILVENLYYADRSVQIVGLGLNLKSPDACLKAISLEACAVQVAPQELMLNILHEFSSLLEKTDSELSALFSSYAAPLWRSCFAYENQQSRFIVCPTSINIDGSLNALNENGEPMIIKSGSLSLIATDEKNTPAPI